MSTGWNSIVRSHPLDIERGPTKLYWYWGSSAWFPVSKPGPTSYCLHSLTTPEPDEPKSGQDAAIF